MNSKVPYQPENYQSVIPYIHAKNAAELISFMKEVFNAEEIALYPRPDGTVGHAAFRIGDSVVELADSGEEWPAMPCAMEVYVPDTDAAYARALNAGASSLAAPTNQFYRDRTASVRDSCGNNWYIATQIEAITKAEVDKRIAAMPAQSH